MSRITAPVGEVTTPITSGRKGSFFLRLSSNKPFGLELLLAILQQLQQRADAGELDALDDELIFRAAGIGRELAGAHHLHPVLGLEAEALRRHAPDHGVEHRLVVLEGEIAMAGAVALEAGDFAAHPHIGEFLLDRALEQVRDLGNGIFRQIAAQRGRARRCRSWVLKNRQRAEPRHPLATRIPMAIRKPTSGTAADLIPPRATLAKLLKRAHAA